MTLEQLYQDYLRLNIMPSELSREVHQSKDNLQSSLSQLESQKQKLTSASNDKISSFAKQIKSVTKESQDLGVFASRQAVLTNLSVRDVQNTLSTLQHILSVSNQLSSQLRLLEGNKLTVLQQLQREHSSRINSFIRTLIYLFTLALTLFAVFLLTLYGLHYYGKIALAILFGCGIIQFYASSPFIEHRAKKDSRLLDRGQRRAGEIVLGKSYILFAGFVLHLFFGTFLINSLAMTPQARIILPADYIGFNSFDLPFLFMALLVFSIGLFLKKKS